MLVKCFTNNPFQENTYVLSDLETHECIVVDPGMSNASEWGRVQDYMKAERLTPVRILLTHCHVDHMMGSGYLAAEYGLPVSGPVDDYHSLPAPILQGELFGVSWEQAIPAVTQDVKEGDLLHLGNNKIQVFDVPGHSFHGLCYYLPEEQLLFTGDVLFFCSIGRSDFGPQMGCNGESLVEGIRCKLMSLPPTIRVYPGHGPYTTIQNELQCNPYF